MRKAYPDLRSFLKVLEEEGQLVKVTEEVMPEKSSGKYQKRTGGIF